jgi:3-hydroxyisobutyrate dehydrogenase-like beta-hydroxyacid dehydrogenase
MTRIALIGFGEVGQRLAHDLHQHGEMDLIVWDVLFADPSSTPAQQARARRLTMAPSMARAVADAELVISAVTAASAVDAACEAAKAIPPAAWFLDLNSISPDSRIRAAGAMEDAGARYVEAAVMSPIHPHGVASPILLGGPHADTFDAPRFALSHARPYSRTLGQASAAKMCRSVVIKGMESLFTEALLAARHYGVEETVIASLSGILPPADWAEKAHYMISRSVEHGARRAAEMREVAATVREAGIDPIMSTGAASRQSWAAQRIAGQTTLTSQLDALLASR